MRRRRRLILLIGIPIVLALVGTGIWLLVRHPAPHVPIREAKTEAPPDLERLRPAFLAGLDALQRGEGAEAVRVLSSFHFGKRAVEEYRLYFLANGLQLANDPKGARVMLATLWQRTPKLSYWEDAGINLGDLYLRLADWRHAGAIESQVAARTENPAIAATARWNAINARFNAGDIGGVLAEARNIAIKSPRSPQAADALAVVRSLTGLAPNAPIILTPDERYEHATNLLRDGDPQSALDELTTLDAAGAAPALHAQLQLQRGLALTQLRRFEEANKLLDPLASGPFKLAIPAVYNAARNYRVLSDSVNPIVLKTVVIKQKLPPKKGSKKPRFRNVKKTVQLVDLAKKTKKDEWDRLSIERLKDLLALPIPDEMRIEVLNDLIARAEAKNQDDYEQELVTKLVQLEPASDPGLQHFWDKAWAAYSRGDWNGARPLFTYIRDTYRNPNVKRQSAYWYARVAEHLGQKDEASRIYRELASAPYDDLYALHAQARGAPRQENNTNPVRMNRPDWRIIAEQNMPAELRLAYELTALFDMRDARLEIQRNTSRANETYADALLADLYHSDNNLDLTYRYLRKAFPQLATVEQDSVPPYFLKMYYPIKYEDDIRKQSQKNGLDPNMIMALILQESYFNPKAKSPVGATGLMQLMPATGRELGSRLHGSFSVTRLENPETNIELGTLHFKMLVNLFGGDAKLAIASYNAGQGNVLRWRRGAPHKPMDEFLESIPFPETRNYVKRVLLLTSAYRRLTL